ncbi:hypothetical protein ACFVAV_11085 [Nocardia sp. NPDC057663]|uniref:hypothetical protein n=1 Tax=Nocardia sp. NPDC057663 TaxID=3346201 RepID=UPI00366B36B1
MKSRSVSCTLPALVAMALVSAGCGTGAPAHRAATTTKPPVTSTARPTTTTPSATTSARPTTSTAAQPTAVGICVDTTSSTRVADGLCGTSDTRYANFWYQHTDTLVYPAIGAAVALAAGSFLRPSGTGVYDRGVPDSGGTVQRGGLGNSRPDSGDSAGS